MLVRTISVMVALFCLAGCPVKTGPYAVAAQTTLASRVAGDVTDKAFAAGAAYVMSKCLREHSSKTPGFVACTAKLKEHLDRWQSKGRPAVNAAVTASYRALQLAKEVDKDEKEVLAIAKQAICLVVATTRQFQSFFPAEWRDKLTLVLGLVQFGTCESTLLSKRSVAAPSGVNDFVELARVLWNLRGMSYEDVMKELKKRHVVDGSSSDAVVEQLATHLP